MNGDGQITADDLDVIRGNYLANLPAPRTLQELPAQPRGNSAAGTTRTIALAENRLLLQAQASRPRLQAQAQLLPPPPQLDLNWISKIAENGNDPFAKEDRKKAR